MSGSLLECVKGKLFIQKPALKDSKLSFRQILE